jgi:hydrogenase expression/formation protein HypC
MCVGIPARVVRLEGVYAVCRTRAGEQRIDLLLVDGVAQGDYLLTFLGSARGRLSEDEARRIDAALDGLDAAMSGQVDLSVHFADLIDREPTLPEFLRGGGS